MVHRRTSLRRALRRSFCAVRVFPFNVALAAPGPVPRGLARFALAVHSRLASTREQGGTGNKSNGFLQPSLKKKKTLESLRKPVAGVAAPVLVTLRVLATPSPYLPVGAVAFVVAVLAVPPDRLPRAACARLDHSDAGLGGGKCQS